MTNLKIKQAYCRGFVKAAMAEGMTEQEATQQADNNSSWLGRYLAMNALRGNTNIDRPVASNVASMPHQVAARGLEAAVRAQASGLDPLSMAGGMTGLAIPSEMLLNRVNLGGTEEKRKKVLHDTAKKNKETTYGDALVSGLKKSPIFGAVGAGTGYLGSMAAQKLFPSPNYSPNSDIEAAIKGGVGGAMLPPLALLINKFLLNHISDESQDRAIAMKAKHPYATSLPFGDMIGAAAA